MGVVIRFQPSTMTGRGSVARRPASQLLSTYHGMVTFGFGDGLLHREVLKSVLAAHRSKAIAAKRRGDSQVFPVR
jgi:hypothetical protein